MILPASKLKNFKTLMRLLNNKLLFVIIGLTIIFISNLIGHFAAPFSISATPIILPLVIGLINFSLYKANFYLTVLYGFGLLLLNDILIRLFAGGTHDDAGNAWIVLYFIIAFSICVLAMIAYAFKINESETTNKQSLNIVPKITFVIILATTVVIFYDKFFSNFLT